MNNKKKKVIPLVSVITPMYNSEKFICDTIKSVQMQTFGDFEMIIVDDLSTDNSVSLVKKEMLKDNRIKFQTLTKKGGASVARNLAIKNAKGRYIAFLDADDTWEETKLEKQLKFMAENRYAFTYTNFNVINENGVEVGTKTSRPKTTYKNLLYRNTIGCLTVIYDSDLVGLVQIPRIDKRNDYALWLNILKNVDYGYCINESLSSYRINSKSLSNSGSKFSLLKYHFELFRRIEEFSILKSSYYTFMNIMNYIIQGRK